MPCLFFFKPITVISGPVQTEPQQSSHSFDGGKCVEAVVEWTAGVLKQNAAGCGEKKCKVKFQVYSDQFSLRDR